MRRERLTAISLAYVITVASIAGVLLAFGPGVAAASHGGTPYAVGQGGQCVAEIHPLGDGSTSGPEYYDYGNYGSRGTTDIQQTNLSQLYVYSGSDGTSLVFLHDRYGDGTGGGSVSFYFDGLPASGEWTVEDDDYLGQDDRAQDFNRSAVHWMYGYNKTDGGMYVGLGNDDWSEITIDPAFADESWAWTERDPRWNAPEYPSMGDNGPQEWVARSADGSTTQLDMDLPVSLREGGCDAVSPTAALSGPDTASADAAVTLEASSPDSPTTPIEYRWDFQNDGTIDATTTSTTIEHSYSSSGQVTAAVTVVDRFGETETATKTIAIEGNEPPTAVASVPASATVGETVTVDASGSSDDEGIASYEWTFGDGSTATGATATHAYGAAGNYTVTLTVTDGEGANDTATGTIEVTEAEPSNRAPTVDLTAEPTSVTAGGNVTLAANASDPDGDELSYTWSQVAGNESLDLPAGESGTVAPSEPGSYEVSVTVEDSAGANASATAAFDVVAENQPPDAAFDWSPSTPAPNETVTFDASNASDPDGDVTGYAWDFDGDGSADASGEQATYAFASAGSHDVTLTVTDDDGAADSATRTVSVGVENAAPSVELDAAPATVTVGDPVGLTATASDPDEDQLTYTWETLSGPGSLDLPSGSDGTVTPPEAGTYEVRVTVTDGAGASDSASVTFQAVESNAAPTPAFEWTPADPTTSEAVTFDASNSSDADGSIASYEWDLDDDGSYEVAGENFTHAFASSGAHDVTLRVTDDGGANASTTETVHVTEPASDENRSPTAALDANETQVAPGDSISLDAAGSTDPDGDALSYAWRVVSAPSGTNVTPPSGESGEVTLPAVGEYTFEVTVDDGNATDSATATVTVAEANEAPTATFDWSPADPVTSDTVDLNASASTDPDGSIVRYEWDADDDGDFEASGGLETLAHGFTTAGSHDVTLRVTDDDGATDTVTRMVEVGEPTSEDNQPPDAVLFASNTSVGVGETVTLDGMDSSDPDGPDDALSIEWTVVTAPSGASLPTFDAALTNDVSFDTAGTYEVRLTVTDAENATDSATKTIDVSADTGTGDGGTGDDGSGDGGSGDGDSGDGGSAEPNLHVHDVSADRTAVEVDGEITFSVTVHNDGDATGTKTIDVVRDGTVVDGGKITVAPGEKETKEIVYCPVEPGNYAVTVAGETFDLRVTAPEHDLKALSVDSGETLDASSPGHVVASATLTVETDVVSRDELDASLASLDASAFDATIGAANASVTNVTAGEPTRRNSTWAVPLSIEVDAASNDPGAYDLRIGVDLPHACWPIADSDCAAGSRLAVTSEDAIVYEAASSSDGGGDGGGAVGGGSSAGSVSYSGGSNSASDATDKPTDETTTGGATTETTNDDEPEETASPATTTSITTTTQERTTEASTPASTETASPGQPGFGVLLTVLALLAVALLARIRS